MKFIRTFVSAIFRRKLHFFWLPRVFGLLFVPGFLFDIEILVLFQTAILLHASLGLEVIIEDYVHIELVKHQCLLLTKIFLILLANLNILYIL